MKLPQPGWIWLLSLCRNGMSPRISKHGKELKISFTRTWMMCERGINPLQMILRVLVRCSCRDYREFVMSPVARFIGALPMISSGRLSVYKGYLPPQILCPTICHTCLHGTSTNPLQRLFVKCTCATAVTLWENLSHVSSRHFMHDWKFIHFEIVESILPNTTFNLF